MSSDRPGRAAIESLGEPVTAETLPPAGTLRWMPHRKAQVVCAIRDGIITREEACRRYDISNAELFTWERLLDEDGIRALQITRAHRYRSVTKSSDRET